MIAGNLISQAIVPLKTSDTGEEALSIMADYYVKHLPIVNNEQLLGLISEEDLLDHDVAEPLGSYQLSLNRPYAKADDHIYKVLHVLSEFKLTVIPVVDREDNYLGMITQDDLLRFFAQIGSFTEPGSIIVLEMGKRDYSLSQIAQIAESENAAILSSFITSSLDSTRIDVTIKVNKPEVQRIISTFDRFNIKVKATFQEATYLDGLKDRYDSLMSYLNV
ncbi:MAG: CBS domain-containing protein [Saprospiraceae bacterium]